MTLGGDDSLLDYDYLFMFLVGAVENLKKTDENSTEKLFLLT